MPIMAAKPNSQGSSDRLKLGQGAEATASKTIVSCAVSLLPRLLKSIIVARGLPS
jgi:hypothetical protein